MVAYSDGHTEDTDGLCEENADTSAVKLTADIITTWTDIVHRIYVSACHNVYACKDTAHPITLP